MLRLRPYKKCDAKDIVTWCRDERTFLLWGGDRFGLFPITADVMNRKYFEKNGDCAEGDNFYPFTAFDEEGIVGHFIMRYLGGDSRLLRFGWVIVDDAKHGRGYGKEMLTLGLRYAFEILRVDTVTIGVFENNVSAYRCYRSVGFRKAENAPEATEEIQGETWRIMELELTRDEYKGLKRKAELP